MTDVAKLYRKSVGLGLMKSPPLSPSNYFTPDELNPFFAGIFCALRPCGMAEVTGVLEVLLADSSIFEFAEVTAANVALTVTFSASPTYAASPVGVSLFTTHKALPRLAVQLALLFNASLRLGYYPPSWKRAYSRPLLKQTPPTFPFDIRLTRSGY